MSWTSVPRWVLAVLASLSVAGAALSPALVGVTPAYAASTTVVLNEVSRSGYVELRNLRAQPVDISGWSLWLCRASGNLATVHKLVTVPAGHSIPGNGYYLLAAERYAGTPSADLVWNGARDQDGFPSSRVTDRTGAVVDQVSTLNGSKCLEGQPASGPLSTLQPDTFALGRSTASDSDSNSGNFGDVPRSPTASGLHPTPVRQPMPISMLRDSSVDGQTYSIEAVVTGIDDRSGSSYNALYPEDRGLFVQEEAADQDGDPATSEGIFVAGVKDPSAYRPGDVVRVTGQVKDKFRLRVITYGSNGTGVPQKVGTGPVPAPVEIDHGRARSEGAAYFETLEGMRVRLSEGTANSGGTNKFGEAFVTTGDEQRRFFRTDTRKDLLGIADDAGAGNPANAYKDRRSTTRVELDLFDRVEDVVGPLGFSYENYKIYPQPGAMPKVKPYAGKRYPVRLAGSRPGQLRIASFNVENFFPVGVPVGGPGTESTPQGVPTREEYDEQRAEILTALDDVLGRPEVIAIQEVYANTAGSTALADLAAGLAKGTETYTAYVAKSNDSRGIANGFLVKSTVTAGNPRLLGASETSSACSTGKLYDRPPFALDLTVGDRVVTLFNNHFKSKGGSDEGVPCREAQATWLRARVAETEATGNEAIVLGDLNSFEDESPLTILTNPATTTLTNLWSRPPAEERYSYAYQGRLQTLDHMLVTDTIAASVEDFQYATIDTDYADRVRENGEKVIDGHGLSDHNPPVLTIPTALSDAGPDPVVPETPWPALMLLAGVGAGAGTVAWRARRT